MSRQTFQVEVFLDGSVIVHSGDPVIHVPPELLARVVADGISGWRTENSKHSYDMATLECLN